MLFDTIESDTEITAIKATLGTLGTPPQTPCTPPPAGESSGPARPSNQRLHGSREGGRRESV